MRRNPSTVVVLTGRTTEQVLAAVGRSLNVVLVRPEEQPPGAGTRTAGTGNMGADGLEAAAGALRRAAGIAAPYGPWPGTQVISGCGGDAHPFGG